MADSRAYLLNIPIPPLEVLERELGHIAHHAESVRELVKDQKVDGNFTSLLQLSCISLEMDQEEEKYQTILQLIKDMLLTQLPEESELRRSASYLFGFDGPAAGLGISDRRAAASEAADMEKVGSWERRFRPRIFEALAHGLFEYEKNYRALRVIDSNRRNTKGNETLEAVSARQESDVNRATKAELYGLMRQSVSTLQEDIEQVVQLSAEWRLKSKKWKESPDSRNTKWSGRPDPYESLLSYARFSQDYGAWAKEISTHGLSTQEATKQALSHLGSIVRCASLWRHGPELLEEVKNLDYTRLLDWIELRDRSYTFRRWCKFVESCRCLESLSLDCQVHHVLRRCELFLEIMRSEYVILMRDRSPRTAKPSGDSS